jgi:hypothetical protein
MNGVFLSFFLSFYCFSHFINIGLILRRPYLVSIVPCGLVTTLYLKTFHLNNTLMLRVKLKSY